MCLFAHPAELSLRDLAVLMLTISDNTATDAMIRRIGPERIGARLTALGLVHTDFTCTIHEHFSAIAYGLGFSSLAEHSRPRDAPRSTHRSGKPIRFPTPPHTIWRG